RRTSSTTSSTRRSGGSPAAPTRCCETSSPNALWACPATCASTRTCRSRSCRRNVCSLAGGGGGPRPPPLRGPPPPCEERSLRYRQMMSPVEATLPIGPDQQVSGLWLRPDGATAALVLAHGAGAGMAHRNMATLAEGLAQRGVATLRYNFLYMERGSKRPDAPKLAQAAVPAAVAQAARLARDL